MTETCRDCKFFRGEGRNSEHGQCRRYAPKPNNEDFRPRDQISKTGVCVNYHIIIKRADGEVILAENYRVVPTSVGGVSTNVIALEMAAESLKQQAYALRRSLRVSGPK